MGKASPIARRSYEVNVGAMPSVSPWDMHNLDRGGRGHAVGLYVQLHCDAEPRCKHIPSTCSSSCGSGQPVAHSCPGDTRTRLTCRALGNLTRPPPTVAWLAARTEALMELAMYARAYQNITRTAMT
jgi:hypothetical protein